MEKPIAGPWEACTRDGTLKVRGPATAKRYKQREVCRVYGANRATVDLICAAPELRKSCEDLLALVHDAILHGMPVTAHVAAVRNAACDALNKADGK